MHFFGLISLAFFAYAKVIEVSDTDIGDYLHNGIPTIIDFYATWCGHCKTFSPVFDELAAKYEHLGEDIQFIKIDGDKNRKAAARFKIQYFPTIKYIDSDDNVEEIDERNIHYLQKFIKEKVGIIPESQPKAPKNIQNVNSEKIDKISRSDVEFSLLSLIDDNFEENIRGKKALVSFTTQWCQYCKAMASDWEKLARVYEFDSDLVIANVDCSDLELTYSLTEIFNIEGYPEILYFSNNEDEDMPTPYAGARTLESFINFLNSKGLTQRLPDGSLSDEAGIDKSLDLSYLPNYAVLLNQIRDDTKHAELYRSILTKANETPGYINKELARTEKLISQRHLLTREIYETFVIKRNILNSLASYGEHVDQKDSYQQKEEL